MTAQGSAIALIVNQEAGRRLGTPPMVDELVSRLERYGLRPEVIVIKKGSDPVTLPARRLGAAQRR